MLEADVRYNNLKNKVLESISANNYDLQALKDYFKDYINSPRTLNRIKTLPELIEILEERDVLSCLCVSPFYDIANLLKNEEIKNTVTVYRKILLEDRLCSCGVKVEYISPSTRKEGNGFTDLGEAIKTVASRMKNGNWRVLASELKVIEKQIDLCYKNYDNPNEQALQMLQFWIENNKENATVEQLDKALNSRLCIRQGFGTHLRKPVAGKDF